MRKILKTDTGGSADQIGRQSSGVYYAHNYAYVLPQVGTVTASTTSGASLAWSSISLDRVSKSIVMVEYTCASGCASYPNRAARAIRFPFASGATTFAATTTASEALQLPWYNLNGVASHNGRWWFNSSGAKKLYYWTSAAGAHVFVGRWRRKHQLLGRHHEPGPAVVAAGDARAPQRVRRGAGQLRRIIWAGDLECRRGSKPATVARPGRHGSRLRAAP
jgi:hypothetical protein